MSASKFPITLPSGQRFEVLVDPDKLDFPRADDATVLKHIKASISILTEQALKPLIKPILSAKTVQHDAQGRVVGMVETAGPSPAEMAVRAGDEVAERFMASIIDEAA